MEKSCYKCAFGGCKIEKENLFKCDNENVKDRKTLDGISKYWLLGDRGNECEEFIPVVELEDKDIDCYMVIDVYHKCPYCHYEAVEYSEDSEGDRIIKCSNCGKKYKIYWSVE